MFVCRPFLAVSGLAGWDVLAFKGSFVLPDTFAGRFGDCFLFSFCLSQAFGLGRKKIPPCWIASMTDSIFRLLFVLLS